MSRKATIGYFAHSVRSDWNNGNAHFIRGLLRGLGRLGHQVTIFEPASGWSIENLCAEKDGPPSLNQFSKTYPDLIVRPYQAIDVTDHHAWVERLEETDIVIVHEWNPPELGNTLRQLREELSFRLIFHDTHHRASSSPDQIRLFGIPQFDGVLAFGEALSKIYRDQFDISRVWTLHEAADASVFQPDPSIPQVSDVIWIGNWGDDERSTEIKQYLLHPATELPNRRFSIYGVRYPQDGQLALREAGANYGGYLSNINARTAYATSRLTVHIPRQQYVTAMMGIPTIRVFEALACGIPLISAPWTDVEQLFRAGDYLTVNNPGEMRRAMELLLNDPEMAQAQALRGLETVLARHTCQHRAEQLSGILEESFT